MSAPHSKQRLAFEALLATLLYAAAVPWLFRPWFLADGLVPHWTGTYGPMVDADLNLNIWILAWAAHAAWNDPAALFDGNIFHPAPRALLGSENMLAHLPFTAPVLAWTGSALAVLKTYVLESIALSGLGMFLYVRHHTRDFAAALFAGAAYTFTAFRVETVPQPQYLGIAFLPLALLCADLWMETFRRRWVVLLAASLAAQAWSCVYVGFFTLLAVPLYCLCRLPRAGGAWPRVAGGWIVGGLGAAVLLVPLAIPYLEARAEGMVPDHAIELVRAASWTPALYFTDAFVNRVGPWAIALAGYGLLLLLTPASADTRAERARQPRMALWAVFAGAIILGLGPVLVLPGLGEVSGPYAWLSAVVPGFSSLRVPVRFVMVAAAALSALAGFALAEALARWRPAARLAAAFLLAAACVQAAAPQAAATAKLGPHPDAQVLYEFLAAQDGDSALLEIPGPTQASGEIGADLRNSRYMVGSTRHWRPLLNGYTAYPPPGAAAVFPAVRDLPAADALQELVDLTGVGWIVLHRDELAPHEARRWDAALPPALHLVKRSGGVELYRVELAPEHDWQRLLAARPLPAETTFTGTPIRILEDGCEPIELAWEDPPEHFSRLPVGVRVGVRIVNGSGCALPALAVRSEGLVGLAYRWRREGGGFGPRSGLQRLRADIPAHSAVDASLAVAPPGGAAGRHELEILLVQEGRGEPLARLTGTFGVGPRPSDPPRVHEGAPTGASFRAADA